MKSQQTQDSSGLVVLGRLELGKKGRLARIDGGQAITWRLLSLGLRLGSELQVLHHRGRGVVVASGNNRIAIGAGIADKLLIEPFAAPPARPENHKVP